MDFNTSCALCTPPVMAMSARNMPIDDRDPVKTQQQFARMTQRQAGNHVEFFDIKIGLVKPVEEHQSARP